MRGNSKVEVENTERHIKALFSGWPNVVQIKKRALLSVSLFNFT